MRNAVEGATSSCLTVLFCCNASYFQHLAVAMVSLLSNNARNHCDIHVISSGSDEAAERKLRCSLISDNNYRLQIHYFEMAKYNLFYTGGSSYISRETYLRIFAAHVLPKEIDKVIYLDADLVVLDDLLPLWRTQLDDYVLAAVKDPYGSFRKAELSIPPEFSYINAGVLLINLKKWRDEQITQRLVGFIESQGEKLMFHDQDAINAVLYGEIRIIDYRWNLQAKMFRLVNGLDVCEQREIRVAHGCPAILHYSSAHKPWVFSISVVPMSRFYHRYLDMTQWHGTPKTGFSWFKVPEHLIFHLLDRCGFDHRFLRRYDNSIMRMVCRILRSTIGVARLLHENRKRKDDSGRLLR